jgi:DNA-binding MarR family transcriptional regulator
MMDGYLRGALRRSPTPRQIDVLAAFVSSGGSVAETAARVGVRPSTAKRHMADLRALGPDHRATDLSWAGGGVARRSEP